MMFCAMAGRQAWPARLARWPYLGLLVLVLAYLALHLAVISQPGQYVFDEKAYVTDAQLINGDIGTQRPEHPPLGKLIIAKGIALLGDNPWGWRLPAVLASTLSLVLFYSLTRRLGLSHRVSFLATFLLTFENLFFIHGGLAMLDVYLIFFTLLAFWLYLRGPSWWWAAAVSGAAATLCKFSGLLVFPAIALHWLYTERQTVRALCRRASPAPASGFLGRYGRALTFLCSLLLAPVAFVLLYWGCDYFIWGAGVDVFADMRTALTLTAGIKVTTPVAALPSRPWEWLLSPTNSFKFYAWLAAPRSVPTFVLAYSYTPHMGGLLSPSLWLSTLAVWPYLIWRTMKRRLYLLLAGVWLVGVGLVPALLHGHVSDLTAAVLSFGWLALAAGLLFFMADPPHDDNAPVFVFCWLMGTWAAWLPLSILTDRITYAFYYLPAVPALALGAAFLLERLLTQAATRLRSLARLAAGTFLLLHLAAFCVLAPVKLTLAVPVTLLVLLVSLAILGYRWRTLAATAVAVGGWVLSMRLFLYPWLLAHFDAEIVAGGYPLGWMVWLMGILTSAAVLAALFFFTSWLLGRLMPLRAALPAGAASAEG